MKKLKKCLALIIALLLSISSALALEPLTVGSKGDAVKDMQTRLKELGYYSNKVDGDFGNKSKEAVKAFQAGNGLTQDGVASVEVLELMYSENAVPAAPFDEAKFKKFECKVVNANDANTATWCQDKDFRALFTLSMLMFDLRTATKTDINLQKPNYVIQGKDEKLYLLTQGKQTVTLVRYDTVSNQGAYIVKKGTTALFNEYLDYFKDTLGCEVYQNHISDLNRVANTVWGK